VVKSKPDGIASLVLAGPLLSTARWIDDANQLRARLPEPVQRMLTLHEQAGTTDSKEYQAATEVFYDNFLYHRQPRPEIAACKGSAFNEVIYEQMWGPSEFHATGSLLHFDVTPRLADLHLPVLFIVGRYDEARPETVADFQALVQGARLEVLEQSGHMAPVEEPERYLEILRDFFRSVDTGKSTR
jgi:proline iminopeptidase